MIDSENVDLDLLKYLCGLLDVGIGSDGRLDGATDSFWGNLTRLASEQLVLTVMASALRRLDELPPGAEEALSFYDQIAENNAKRNRWLLQQLDEANSALASAGVPAITLKGGAFLLDNRSDAAGWRFFGDLDFLVGDDRLDDAVVALKAIGYLESDLVYHPKFHRHYPFLRHPGGETGIDLHTRLAGLDQSVLLDPDRFFADATTHSAGGIDVRIPAPTERMAHLIVNAQILDYRYARRIFRLRDALDFAQLNTRYAIDMVEIRRRFHAYGDAESFDAYVTAMGDVVESSYSAPEGGLRERKWVHDVREVMRDPRRARIHVFRHWMQMLFRQILDPDQRRHLVERLRDRQQRQEFISRRLSYWRVFRR